MWRDALTMQMLFKKDLRRGGLLEEMLDSFEQTQRGIHPHSGTGEVLPNQIGLFKPVRDGGVPYQKGGMLPDYFRGLVDQAIAFYVDPAMEPVVTAASMTMPNEVLRWEDLPATHGFMLIPGGIAQIDVRGKLLVSAVAAWAVRRGGVDLWLLVDKDEDRDYTNAVIAAKYGPSGMLEMPQLSPGQYIRMEFGQEIPTGLSGAKVLPPELSNQVLIQRGPNGEMAWFWPEGYSPEELAEWVSGTAELQVDPIAKWVTTCWRLMQQTLTDVTEERVDRRTQKVARKIRMRQQTVTKISLRRVKGRESDGEAHIEWSHRFWRRGHSRNVWVGPRGGGPDVRYQRAVYIHPTIVNKDREDLPFLDRTHVNALER